MQLQKKQTSINPHNWLKLYFPQVDYRILRNVIARIPGGVIIICRASETRLHDGCCTWSCYCHTIVAHVSAVSVHLLIWLIGLGHPEWGELRWVNLTSDPGFPFQIWSETKSRTESLGSRLSWTTAWPRTKPSDLINTYFRVLPV